MFLFLNLRNTCKVEFSNKNNYFLPAEAARKHGDWFWNFSLLPQALSTPKLVKIWNCLFISTVALHRVHNEKNWPGSLVTTASMVSYLRPAGPCYLWRTLTGHWSDVCTGIHQTTTNLPFPNLILALSQCPDKFIANHSCISGDYGFLYYLCPDLDDCTRAYYFPRNFWTICWIFKISLGHYLEKNRFISSYDKVTISVRTNTR